MEVGYRKELKESYLILNTGNRGDEYTSRIMTENRIPGLLPVSVRSMDGDVEYYYEISGKQSLKKILEKQQIGCEEMRSLLYGIMQALENMEEYLLTGEQLMLEPEFVYATPDLKNIFLCCHPDYEGDLLEGFRGLTRFFLNKIDHMEKNSVEMAYGLFQVANQESFPLEELLAVLEQYRECDEKQNTDKEYEPDILPAKDIFTGDAEVNNEGNEELPEHLQRKSRLKPWYLVFPVLWILGTGGLLYRGMIQGIQAGIIILAIIVIAAAVLRHDIKERIFAGRRFKGQNTGAETYSESSLYYGSRGESTVVLEGVFTHLPRARLLLSQNSLRYETITMKIMPCTIGKLEEVCDEIIDHPAISRIHARIEEREDGFYLTDLNSTNGTRLNGNHLEPNRPYLLKEGDEVMLADLKYIFQ